MRREQLEAGSDRRGGAGMRITVFDVDVSLPFPVIGEFTRVSRIHADRTVRIRSQLVAPVANNFHVSAYAEYIGLNDWRLFAETGPADCARVPRFSVQHRCLRLRGKSRVIESFRFSILSPPSLPLAVITVSLIIFVLSKRILAGV